MSTLAGDNWRVTAAEGDPHGDSATWGRTLAGRTRQGVICIYRDNADYSRSVEEWLENFRRTTGREIATMNPDENPSFCETYDIVEYPTIIALGESGEVRAMWRGKNLPLLNEVMYYTI